jgi:hypothetical protein
MKRAIAAKRSCSMARACSDRIPYLFGPLLGYEREVGSETGLLHTGGVTGTAQWKRSSLLWCSSEAQRGASLFQIHLTLNVARRALVWRCSWLDLPVCYVME